MTYSYFQKYPLTVFSLDEYKSGQVLPNLTFRSKFLSNVVTNSALYDLYDIVDGETPESTAAKFYGDAGLHWIILQSNDILDPRFGWPLSPFDLKKFAEGKYTNINGAHHYEDNSGDIVTTANVTLTPAAQFGMAFISVGDVIKNNTGLGLGVVETVNSNFSNLLPSNIIARVSQGGFVAGDNVVRASNGGQFNSFSDFVIESTEVTNGSLVTNILFEDNENEKKRQIKILNVDLVPDIISEFESLMRK